MTTNFGVKIHKKGDENNNILNMIANHNGGVVNINLSIIESYILACKAIFPYANKHYVPLYDCEGLPFVNKSILHISEDNGETFTLTIFEKEVEGLNNAKELADLKITDRGITAHALALTNNIS